ncbi:hypothetical protein OROGR_001153 [Orobanche gracilis]
MALCCKLRSLILRRQRFFSTSIPISDSTPLLRSKEKSRVALSLIRFEQNPERIIEICRCTPLSPESHLDRLVYSKAVSKLRELNDHESIRSFVRESMANLNCNTERSVSHFIILYGQGGLVSDAVKLFDEMPDMGIERNVKTLNSLLFSCLLAREYGEMRRIFRDFPGKYGLDPNLETYNRILNGLCDSGNANEAHAILAEMERKGIKPNTTTFATVIEGFYAEQNFVEVGKTMNLMKKHGMEPGISIYNVRIQSLCKLKRSAEAKALLDGILSKGMQPNCATYGHLIYGFCREGKLDYAKSLFKEMVGMGLEPEAECCFTFVYYLCQGRDFEAALGVFKECMAKKGWVPNITTMKLLVDGLASIGKVNEAKEIIGHMKKKFSRNADSWSEIEDRLPQV